MKDPPAKNPSPFGIAASIRALRHDISMSYMKSKFGNDEASSKSWVKTVRPSIGPPPLSCVLAEVELHAMGKHWIYPQARIPFTKE